MQEPACRKALAIVTYRSEEWSLAILAVFGEIEIVTNALRGLWMNGKASLLAAFAHHLQRIIAAVHMEVSDFE